MKSRLFYFIAALFPLFLLGCIELTFYVFSIADEAPIFVTLENDDRYLRLNPNISKRYFKSSLVLIKGENDFFLKKKNDKTLRIIIQGESSIQGFPYGH